MGKKKSEEGLVTRGTFLKAAGATLVLVAGGGVWRAEERGVFGPKEGPAFEPWKDWRGEGREGPLALVSAAILAANAHNTQPWLFKVGGSRIDLFAGEGRKIGAIDPFSREMHVGLGCALENLLLAARAEGYGYRLALAPDRSDLTHVARVDLSPRLKETSPLYEAIPKRHTNRYPYDASRPLRPETLSALGALNDEREVGVFWFAEEAERKEVGGLLVDAAMAINADERQSYDNSLRWLRQDEEAIQDHRDGLTLDTLGLSGPPLLAAKMLPSPSLKSSGEAWLSTLRGQARSATAFGILAVRDYGDDAQRMRAGRLWQRMHLWATAHGLAAQPMNQLHERADREAQLGTEPRFSGALEGLLGDPSRRAIFTFRLGYPTRSAPPSPRRTVEDISA
jgi:nitroreductase